MKSLTWSTLSVCTPNLPPNPFTESTWEQCLESLDWYSCPTADWKKLVKFRESSSTQARVHWAKHCTKQPEGEFCYQHASLPPLLKPSSLENPTHLGNLHKDAAMLPTQPRQGKWLHFRRTILCPAFALQKHRNDNRTGTEGVLMVFMQSLKWVPGETHSLVFI